VAEGLFTEQKSPTPKKGNVRERSCKQHGDEMFTFTGLANSNPKSKPTSKPRTLVALEELCPREGHAICPTGPQREAAAFPCPLQYLLR